MSIERSLDGMVGRMLSWLTHPPLHSAAVEETAAGVEKKKRPPAVAEVAEPAVEPVPEVAAAAAEAFVDAAGEEKGERAEPVGSEVEAFVEAGRRGSAKAAVVANAPPAEAAGADELDERVLAALAEAAGGLPVNQLARRTGEKRPALIPRLNRLEASGRIRKEGKAINPSYRLAETET